MNKKKTKSLTRDEVTSLFFHTFSFTENIKIQNVNFIKVNRNSLLITLPPIINTISFSFFFRYNFISSIVCRILLLDK